MIISHDYIPRLYYIISHDYMCNFYHINAFNDLRIVMKEVYRVYLYLEGLGLDLIIRKRFRILSVLGLFWLQSELI